MWYDWSRRIEPTEVLLANLTGSERAHYVQDMFTRIAGRYDLMNRVMTAGQDVRWRREVIRRAALPKNGRLLDMGAGTDIAGFSGLRTVTNSASAS